MTKDELCGRTKRFALDIMILIDELPKQRVQPHLNEAVELTKIMVSSRKTVNGAA